MQGLPLLAAALLVSRSALPGSPVSNVVRLGPTCVRQRLINATSQLNNAAWLEVLPWCPEACMHGCHSQVGPTGLNRTVQDYLSLPRRAGCMLMTSNSLAASAPLGVRVHAIAHCTPSPFKCVNAEYVVAATGQRIGGKPWRATHQSDVNLTEPLMRRVLAVLHAPAAHNGTALVPFEHSCNDAVPVGNAVGSCLADRGARGGAGPREK